MTELLDAKTIFVLTALFSGLITVVFFSIHRGVYAVVNGVLSFAWAYGFFTLFALLLLLRGQLHPLFGVVLADTALSLALLMIADGVCRLKSQTLYVGYYRWYIVACLLAFSWFGLIQPNFQARVGITILCILAVFSWVLLMLCRESVRSWRLGEWILSLSLLASIAAALLRAVMALIDTPSLAAASILNFQGAQAHFLTVNLVATVFIAFGLIVISQDSLRQDLEKLASYDALTGVLTRRVILNLLDKSIAGVVRSGRPLALMMIDLDHFKRINDSFGHRVGDRVLAEVTAAIEGALRKESYIGRYGGEEFLVVMPDTSASELVEVSERVRRVAAKTLICHQQDRIQCTISIGALIIDSHNVDSLHDPLTLADNALYQAKTRGRNQVVVADGPATAVDVDIEST